MLDLLEGTYMYLQLSLFFWYFSLVFLYAILCFQHVSACVVDCVCGDIFIQLCWFAEPFFWRGKTWQSSWCMSDCMVLVVVQQTSSHKAWGPQTKHRKMFHLPSHPSHEKENIMMDDLGKLVLEEFHTNQIQLSKVNHSLRTGLGEWQLSVSCKFLNVHHLPRE